ncbi:hypothetical protein [Granulicella tundricola]|uniref:Uncharacterized protein n=1 Tax=Granulicella tundricola (strain ATCC BAA-1859 / DSM 23138 / MP5ACTX9) TaxID=1198114 RepID=E8X3E1_GRATM|nr:hypothetical protein [Granulicella tundricola]ADW70442.1 hypothetical protein AciX9_3437 [Granulicella tundricola MP5ACTX9]
MGHRFVMVLGEDNEWVPAGSFGFVGRRETSPRTVQVALEPSWTAGYSPSS